jgi:hypothetical protein
VSGEVLSLARAALSALVWARKSESELQLQFLPQSQLAWLSQSLWQSRLQSP